MRMNWWLAVLLMVLAGLSTAATREEMRKQAEASMLLTGTVDIEPDGSVSGHFIDHRERVPDYVLAHIARHVPGWRFEPVVIDGRAAQVRTKMSLRIVARQSGKNDFEIMLAGAHFGGPSEGTDELVRDALTPPSFPREVNMLGGAGDVYVTVKVGRDGQVVDAFVEQVNLKVIRERSQAERMRASLAKSTLKAARTWTFHPPTTGSAADDAFWSARVAVSFRFIGDAQPGYGAWDAYVAGPRAQAPWGEAEAGANDALVAGEVYLVGAGRVLLTPLQPG